MKKTVLFILAIGCNLFVACYDGAIKDNDQPAGYSSDDTTKSVKPANPPADSSGKVGFPK